MRKNLHNVALPGTGVPLSVLCVSKAAVTAFVVAGVPAYALAACLCEVLRPPCATGCRGRLLAALQLYRKNLLAPSDWCTFTRTSAYTHTHTHAHTPTRPHTHTPADLRACMAPLTETCAFLKIHVPGSCAQVFHLEAELRAGGTPRTRYRRRWLRPRGQVDVSPQGARGRNRCFAMVGCVLAGLWKHTFPHFGNFYYQCDFHYDLVHADTLSPWWDVCL